jgi:hypothetical protein
MSKYDSNHRSCRLPVSNKSMKVLGTLFLIVMCPISALACFCPPVEHACEAYATTHSLRFPSKQILGPLALLRKR